MKTEVIINACQQVSSENILLWIMDKTIITNLIQFKNVLMTHLSYLKQHGGQWMLGITMHHWPFPCNL